MDSKKERPALPIGPQLYSEYMGQGDMIITTGSLLLEENTKLCLILSFFDSSDSYYHLLFSPKLLPLGAFVQVIKAENPITHLPTKYSAWDKTCQL